MGWIICCIVSVIVIGILTYINLNLLNKIESYEDSIDEYEQYITEMDSFVLAIRRKINDSYSRIKAIDKLGAFESDDETGYIFKEIKSIIDMLNEITNESFDDGKN